MPSRRMIILALFGLVFAFNLTPDAPAKAETLMQCMTKCIQHEGGNDATNKATCKSRCAASTGVGKAAKPRDCMGEFKACKKGQKSSSAVYKACKQKLMSCK
ncbi:MAG: hypothetical protein HOK06_09300 [Rhodospirillaceae bacterium]|jgi:hypothetical protein|nr:hypothetical protein [Rhodospirillaceae bacterium]MBT4464175.1 hypothetical protein [Rhodospirillaceae bacterium]MBT5012903.1 hypothetical protein [Rhodospirillaceae bacterium]MBT5308229.1 hypothetical protein [Rhodospirillaceae bacterium]MBT6407789.1 hypothetical protein [Rhodospirillaceae bacterium]